VDDNLWPAAGDDDGLIDPIEEIAIALDPEVAAYRVRLGLLSQVMLAHILGINVDTLKVWRKARRGPDYVRIGKRVWYLYPDVANWLRSIIVTSQNPTQRRDYSKMTEHENDPPKPDPKHSTEVDHPTDNPGAAPGFDPSKPTQEDDTISAIPPEGDDEPADPEDGTEDDTGGDEAA